jgi:hypothetical protein
MLEFECEDTPLVVSAQLLALLELIMVTCYVMMLY